MWIALEALFAPSSEVSYRLSSRLALFLKGPGREAQETAGRARDGYETRSKIAHGGRLPKKTTKDKARAMLREAETWVRESLCRIVEDSEIAADFISSEKRDAYLERRVFGVSDAGAGKPTPGGRS